MKRTWSICWIFLLVCVASARTFPREKICIGEEDPEFIHIYNIDKYRGCTTIIGSIQIVQATFDGDPFNNRPGLHPDSLEAFSDVREITDNLMIQGEHRDFRRINFFSNLQVIGGNRLALNTSLNVVATSLRSLEFRSLRRISRGNVVVGLNSDLCYIRQGNFFPLLRREDQSVTVTLNHGREECYVQGNICSDRCSSGYCWGRGTVNCAGGVAESNSIEHLTELMNTLAKKKKSSQ